MFGMNIEWEGQQAQQSQHHRHHRRQQSENQGFFGNLFGGKKEDDKKTGHVYYYQTSSRPSAPRRADTISVLPAGVKMPAGDKPEISYGADGTKYLVIPPKRSNSTRQIIVTSGGSTPKRKDSTASHRATPRRSNSTQVRPTSPPVTRAPKIVGDPELVKQYEHSQRNVARWVESVADSNSPRTPGRTRRTSTR
ncbi:hypothetical protein B0J17DRAFT_713597 [Rhizoctonia solani]|nr:hypothetical protein B0J17DRAFT_713597 [Rhizoctonia solani]